MNRYLRSFYGACLGSAFGTTFRGKNPADIPPAPRLVMPPDYPKSFPDIPYGVWADDAALYLCTLECLVDDPQHALERLAPAYKAWFEEGKHQWHGITFKKGKTNDLAIGAWANSEGDPSGISSKGNGTLTRALALAQYSCLTRWRLSRLVDSVVANSTMTHRDNEVTVCSVLYALVARFMLEGVSTRQALAKAVLNLDAYTDSHKTKSALSRLAVDRVLSFKDDHAVTGSGHCTDTLWGVLDSVGHASSFQDALETSVRIGGATDTLASLAGGLASIPYALPRNYLLDLRMPKESWHVLNGYSQLAQKFNS